MIEFSPYELFTRMQSLFDEYPDSLRLGQGLINALSTFDVEPPKEVDCFYNTGLIFETLKWLGERFANHFETYKFTKFKADV